MTKPTLEPSDVILDVTEAVTTDVLRASTDTPPAEDVTVARKIVASAALSKVLLAMIPPIATPPSS